MKNLPDRAALVALVVSVCALVPATAAGSHREAPQIARDPAADVTDVYAFMNWQDLEVVTFIMNFDPFQEPASDPAYHVGRNEILYELLIDRDGDALSDLTFTFEFGTQYSSCLVQTDDGSSTQCPFLYRHPGPIEEPVDGDLGVFELYDLNVTTAAGTFDADNATTGSSVFFKPLDNVGSDAIPDYDAYADQHIYDYAVPGVPGLTGRVFVGQRRDPFVMNHRSVYAMLGMAPGPAADSHAAHNVTTFALEVPKSVVTGDGAFPVIGVWARSRVSQVRTLNPAPTHPSNAVLPPAPGTPLVQASRMGMPLFNTLFVAANLKDRYNALSPATDLTEFERYLTHPVIAELMGYPSSNRADLVELFLTGIPGLNQNGSVGDMLRLNTGIPAVPPAQQDPLGYIGGDAAGFPNGRRLGDDVVDAELRAVAGVLLGGPGPFDATDGAAIRATDFRATFPYLNAPVGRTDEPTCVVLTQSVSPDRETFEEVPDARPHPTKPDRLVTDVPPEPLVHFLLGAADSSLQPTIETIDLGEGQTLEIVVGAGGP